MLFGWVFVYVDFVLRIVACILDAVFVITLLPDIHLALESKGEASLDELDGLLERNFGGGCDEDVDMIGHQDEGVECVAGFGAVVLKEREHKVRLVVDLEDPAAVVGDEG